MKNFLLLFSLICIPSVLLAQGGVDVNVAANGQMYISKTAFVYVDNGGDVNINATGELIMDSDSQNFSNLYVDGASTGSAEYKRFTASAAVSRDIIAAPVHGEAFNTFYARNMSSIAAGTQPEQAGDFLFGTYDNTSVSGQYQESLSTDTYTLDAGTGYRAGTTDAVGETLSFKGDVTTTDVVVPITYAGLYSGSSSIRFPETNLIGNPYTTNISADQLLDVMIADATDIIDDEYTYIYGYDADVTGTDGATWTRIDKMYLTTLGTDVNIAPGQGFIVYAKDNYGFGTPLAGTLTFNKSMRTVAPATDDFIAGRNAANSATTATNIIANFQLQIENNSNSKTYNTNLFFLDNNASRGLDISWDAGDKTIPAFGIATLLAEDTLGKGTPFTNQVLEANDLSNVSSSVVIPVYVNASAGQSYTIRINEVSNLTGGSIYLEDTVTNTVTLLNNNDYTFTPAADLVGAGRFYLRTNSSSSLSTEENTFSALNIKSILNAKTLKIEGQLNSKTQLSLYDVAGRLINTYTLNADAQLSERFIDVSSVSEGVYVAKLTNNSNQTKSDKIIIK